MSLWSILVYALAAWLAITLYHKFKNPPTQPPSASAA